MPDDKHEQCHRNALRAVQAAVRLSRAGWSFGEIENADTWYPCRIEVTRGDDKQLLSVGEIESLESEERRPKAGD